MFELCWGIIATGGIATQFVNDLQLDPATRHVHDVRHKIMAVGSSSSMERAEKFVADNALDDAKAFGSYDEVINDPAVEIVYIASPASHHYVNAFSAITAGKHVCCEKPFTINAAQAEHLIGLARAKGVFLMEAVWTRFFPAIKPLISSLLSSSSANILDIGKPIRLFSDFSLSVGSHKHRLYDASLGGGCLLDLGLYCLTWAILVLFNDPRNEKEIPRVAVSMIKSDAGGRGPVDETTTITLTFEKARTTAILSSSLAVRTHGDGVVIQCERVGISRLEKLRMLTEAAEQGTITIPHVPCRPETIIVHVHGQEPKVHEYRVPSGHGLHWEADACARAILDGKLEAEECNLAETLTMAKIMDEVRRQGGLRFPDDIEANKM